MSTRLFTATSRLAVFVLLSLPLLGVAMADEGDPPGRVARLSYAQGTVSLQPAGVQDWAAAVVNRPLTTGDKLWTDQDSRAELDTGAAVIRLGSTTGFTLLNLDDNAAQMRVTAGTLIVHVRELLANQTYEIDTPNIALSLERPGAYRVEVNDAGDATVVKISEGRAEATGGGQSVPISGQQMVTFRGTSTLSADTGTLGAPDGLDDWSMGRDRRTEQAQSRRYVSEDVAGYQDLDDNGRWQYTPDYGYVWSPTVVAVGWAPYRYGHWVWISPWGWTWVDDAPWGFAPFHYGRWVYWSDSWCWVPGPHHIHPVYAPALVAWVGGPHFGVSVSVGGVGAVGWIPLGPREMYAPGYHVSETYVRNVNITNTTIVNNTYITNVYNNKVHNIHYVNSTVPGAVTAVPQNVFTSARPVAGHRVRLSDSELAHIAPTAAPPTVVPGRESVLGPGAGRGVRQPPAALLNRPVVARTAPPPAAAPFERQVEAIRANGGRPLPRQEIARLQPSTPMAPVRLVGPPQQAAHGREANGPVTPVQRGPQKAAPTVSSGGAPSSMAERERALQNRVTPTQTLRNDRPPSAQRGGGSPGQSSPSLNGPSPNGAARNTQPVPQDRVSRMDRAAPAPQQRPLRDDRPPSVQRGSSSPTQSSPSPSGASPSGAARNTQPVPQDRVSRMDRAAPAPQQRAPQQDRPPSAQGNRAEQSRPQVNSYSSPPVES
ncbi:MAG: hypothetical protein E6K49_13210, partial [Gammaproteobacteria bacterium]